MPPSLEDRLAHILAAIVNIQRALAGKTYEDFAGDLVLRAAIERFLEMISEASIHVPADAKATEQSIPWQKMKDFGNRLRHAYHSVDPQVVWQIATSDLAPLQAFVDRIIRQAKQ
jgi:uncharacterized protein with HEPN domain